MKFTQSRQLLTLLAALFLTACASKPIAEWRDPVFKGPVDNLLIIGASGQETLRRMFEDTFVRELAALNVKARSSYRELSTEQILSAEALDAAIKDQAMNAVLITRLLSTEEIDVYNPPTYQVRYNNYHSYYRHAIEVTSPGYWETYEVLKLETNLYDTATQRLVWSIQTESYDASRPQQIIEEQVRMAIDSLREAGLVPNQP